LEILRAREEESRSVELIQTLREQNELLRAQAPQMAIQQNKISEYERLTQELLDKGMASFEGTTFNLH
jgi:hypothetical protein